ncbi:MAG: flagellar hook capping protein [Sulfuricurvum sp. PC08-66]|nr:MAG: flagellar hook capping protein [Sulfuricurvum sp. PC08-66]
MAIDSISATDLKAATSKMGEGKVVNPKGALGKDDFLKLLLVELKHQDPTQPVDTEKILSQTSQLATLEASKNTNDELSKLSSSLKSSLQFTTVSAIGKIADTGNDEVLLGTNDVANFEIYVPTPITGGSIEVLDTYGNLVQEISVDKREKGTYGFSWNGETKEGLRADEGSYHVRMKFIASNGANGETGVGVYPISSVRFDEGKTMLRLGSQYVPFQAVKEIR